MGLYEKIVNREEKISLVGLGYVGMPIAVAFAKKVDVIGYDYNAAKIEFYKNGIDPTNEVGNEVIRSTTVQFTDDPAMLRQAKFHVVAIPTPVNDDMGKYVAENVVKKLIGADIPVKNAKVAILGFTFKENCPDTRNTKVIDIYRELQEYGITPVVADPAADAEETKRLYGIEFADMSEIKDMDAVILAVAHEQFKGLTVADFDKLYGKNKKVLIDVKSILDKNAFDEADYVYWRL